MSCFLSVEEVLALHRVLIDEFGGASGVRDMGSLEAAVMRSQSGYYKSLVEEASALMESLAVNHPFLDGNKRISFFATDVFLRMNGCYIDCENEEAHGFLINLLETNSYKYVNLLNWLEEHIKAL